ncbi:GTPase grn1 [Schizosaccharomyces pombe]
MVSLKKKSKRRTTRLRSRIEKKAAESKRKQKRADKKNPQWKSRIPKDPGIPNSFPYKDKILAEIEEQKRIREEENLARRASGQVDAAMEEEDAVDENGSLMISKIAEAAQAANPDDEEEFVMEEDNLGEAPLLVDSESYEASVKADTSRKAYDKEFKKVVEASDVILYVLDARDPEGTRSKDVERQVLASSAEEKRLIFVINKIDLVPSEVLNKWVTYLRNFFPTIPMRSASGSGNSNLKHQSASASSTISNLLKSLKSYSAKKKLKSSLTVGVIGYPNVGKSSVINALVNRSANGRSAPCPAGNVAGMTTSLREVKLDNKLRLVDSPGIVFPSSDSKDDLYRLVMLNAVSSTKVDDPVAVASYILQFLSRVPGQLERMFQRYELPPLLNTSDIDTATDFLVNIARKRGRLGRGGIPNLNAAANIVINDWHAGRIEWWAEPEVINEKNSSEVQDTQIVTEWAKEFDLNDF